MAMSHNLGAARSERFQNPAPQSPGPVVQWLYRGDAITLYEWCCRGEDHGSPREECSDAYEVIVPRRGVFVFEIGGHRVFADPSRAAFLHPGEVYRTHHPLPGGDAGSVFRLGAATAAALMGDGAATRVPACGAALDGGTYWLHRRATRELRDPCVERLELDELALAFVRACLAQAGCRARSTSGSALEYARRVQEVIAARYREPLTLAEVARAVEASPFHLSRLVKAATGLSIHRMIVRRRLRDALEQLLETRETIACIAFATGFASHSHLSDAFKREYGMPPSAVRARRPRRGFPRARP
jgi:AraC family transcriptional regulator